MRSRAVRASPEGQEVDRSACRSNGGLTQVDAEGALSATDSRSDQREFARSPESSLP
jgi:hypothetical protein